ncbi:HIT domain-containing protein [bacterium]|nr:HIT domain-containing protein [bacterium]
MEYIESVNRPAGCVFCRAWGEEDDRASLIVQRGESAFVILNRYPYNNGHLMVVPVRHTADLGGLDDREKVELFDLLEASRKALEEAMHPQGYNLGMNLGRTAGAGIADHLHFHLVPRWNGDTNFMPVLGHTKVVSEGLEQTREKLTRAFKRLNGG